MHSGLTALRSCMAISLWAAGIIAIFLDHDLLGDFRLVVLVAFIALAITGATRLTLVLSAVAVLAAIVWLYSGGELDPIISALRFSLVFSIFLPALVMTRETIEASREIGQARQAFLELTPGQRDTGVLVGSQLLGGILTLGVMAMTAPLADKDSPEDLRRNTILSVLRGLMLAGLWTPFSVGVIYITGFRPDLELIEICGPGFLMALVGSLIAVTIGAGRQGWSQIPSALRIFRPLMPMIGVAIFAVVVFTTLLPFSTIESIALVMPVLCLLKLGSVGTYAARAALGRATVKTGATGNELLLFTAAVLLGVLVRESGAADRLVSILALDTMAIQIAVVVLMLLGPLLSLAGMHSIVTGTVLFALLGPLDERIPDIIEGQIVIYGWMTGAILSFGSLSITVGTGLFRVSVGRIIVSRNLLFVAVFTLVATAIIVAWLSVSTALGQV